MASGLEEIPILSLQALKVCKDIEEGKINFKDIFTIEMTDGELNAICSQLCVYLNKGQLDHRMDQLTF